MKKIKTTNLVSVFLKRFPKLIILYFSKIEVGWIISLRKANFYINLRYFRFKSLAYYFSKLLFTRFSDHIATFIYFVILGFIIFALLKIPNVGLEGSNAISYYTAAATMSGGILAIIFSLSMLLMGYAAERIPVGFYRIAAKDFLCDFIFFLISFCSIVLFGFALSFGKIQLGLAQESFLVSIFLIGLVFYLCFALYVRVRGRLNPERVLQIASSQALKFISQINKRAHEIAKILEKIPDLDKDIKKETVLASAFQYLQADMEYLNQRINFLFDYHDKLVAANEGGSAAKVLKNITFIYVQYFRMRKNSSLLLPFGAMLVNLSDSHSFMAPGLERAMAIGESYLRNNDDRGTTNVINFYVDLCLTSSSINYNTSVPIENPIFAQCRGYLNQLVKSILKAKSFEASFQSASAYGKIGISAIDKGLIYEYEPVLKKLEEICIHALVNNEDIVVQTALNSFNEILTKTVLSTHSQSFRIKSLFEHLKKIILLSFVAAKTGSLEDNYFTLDTLSLPFNTTANLCTKLVEIIQESIDSRDISSKKSCFFELVENLWWSLRFLSERMKNADHLLINTFSDTITSIGCLLLKLTQNKKWVDKKNELIKWAGFLVFQTTWFASKAEKIEANSNFDSLVEAGAKIGIESLQVGVDKTAKDSIKVISNLATEMLKKQTGSNFGFTEPRIMVRVCIVGLLALKLKKQEIFDEAVCQIRAFETAYNKEYFSDLPKDIKLTSPTTDQLLQEMIGLAQKKYRYTPDQLLSALGNTEEKILELVDQKDIENFITKAWGIKDFNYSYFIGI